MYAEQKEGIQKFRVQKDLPPASNIHIINSIYSPGVAIQFMKKGQNSGKGLKFNSKRKGNLLWMGGTSLFQLH